MRVRVRVRVRALTLTRGVVGRRERRSDLSMAQRGVTHLVAARVGVGFGVGGLGLGLGLAIRVNPNPNPKPYRRVTDPRVDSLRWRRLWRWGPAHAAAATAAAAASGICAWWTGGMVGPTATEPRPTAAHCDSPQTHCETYTAMIRIFF